MVCEIFGLLCLAVIFVVPLIAEVKEINNKEFPDFETQNYMLMYGLYENEEDV